MTPDHEKTEAEASVCEGCGRDADAVIDGIGWCVDCYHGRGSCCAGEFECSANADESDSARSGKKAISG